MSAHDGGASRGSAVVRITCSIMRAVTGTIVTVAIIAVAAIAFAHTAVRALVSDPEPAPEDAIVREYQAGKAVSLPVRLRIPALGVAAAIQKVGVNDAGNMRAPSNFSDVSWYAPGTVPGQEGSAVIAGHLDNGLGLPGVFRRLSDLTAGDEIYLESEDGTTLRFVVSGSASYRYDEVPTDIIFNRVDGARLNLITCDGDFLPLRRTYDERFVVFATLATTSPLSL